ncbi:MAG: prepilin-type N-terminal cleavage/methylation domain-containing protein [Clostridiaceae bacterium]
MKKVKKAFTLVELLVVIAIIAILAAIIAPNAFKAIEKSKVATAESDYRAIKTAALTYYSDMGTWPANKTDGIDPGFINGSGDGWNGPYLEKWPTKNPWSGTYTFKNDKIKSSDTTATIYLDLSKVPIEAAKRIDVDLDGTSGSDSGTVRYTTTDGTTTVSIIISEQ